MNNQKTQIIADSQAVVPCLDANITRILGSHSTFTIDELLEKINETSNSAIPLKKISSIFHKVLNVGNYGSPDLLKEINDILPEMTNHISKEKSQSIFAKIRTNRDYDYQDLLIELNGETAINCFTNGAVVSLLQPDGNGWQKGTLKICFELILEEDEPVATAENSIKTQCSSLDEIRQLANSLLIDQN